MSAGSVIQDGNSFTTLLEKLCGPSILCSRTSTSGAEIGGDGTSADNGNRASSGILITSGSGFVVVSTPDNISGRSESKLYSNANWQYFRIPIYRSH